MSEQSPLRMPGGVLMTRLRVYDTLAPDNQYGGTPHVHLMCSEMYIITGGHGAVEMIDMNGFRIVELHPYNVLIFTPGTLHRLINPNRDLELLIVMQNSGLPERGDNVVTFPAETLADENAYAEAMRVTSPADAYRRRDAGVEGFLEIKAAFEESLENGQQKLKQFYKHAAARTKSQLPKWETIVKEGAQAEVETTFRQIAALQSGNIDYLTQSQQVTIELPDDEKLGFCGHLNRYFDPATLALEGILQEA